MTGWLELSDQQRKITLEQASLESGLKAEAIEKDWWVTLVLKALFEGKFKNYLTFKGLLRKIYFSPMKRKALMNFHQGFSASLVAGAGFEPTTFGL